MRSFDLKTFMWPYGIQAVFSPTYHKTQLNLSPASPANSVVIPCQLHAVLLVQDGAIYRPPRHSQTSDMMKKEASVKTDCCIFGYSTHKNCKSENNAHLHRHVFSSIAAVLSAGAVYHANINNVLKMLCIMHEIHDM